MYPCKNNQLNIKQSQPKAKTIGKSINQKTHTKTDIQNKVWKHLKKKYEITLHLENSTDWVTIYQHNNTRIDLNVLLLKIQGKLAL